MTITDSFATALTGYLTDQVSLASTVDNGIRANLVTEFDNRVVVNSTSATERFRYVQGLYDLSGEVYVQQSVDSEDAESKFRSLSEEVRALLEDKRDMPGKIEAYNPDLRIHSWNFVEQVASPSERGFQTIFSWTAFAELPHA